MPYHIALLAAACEIAGQVEEALTLLDEALQTIERTGERWFAAEIYRQKGQLLHRQGHSEAAEELYRKALNIAREQQAKLWELRVARASPSCGATGAAVLLPATFSRRSTGGSIQPIGKRQRSCSTNSTATTNDSTATRAPAAAVD
jgi:tetratricopeptide (TPR) repeat protein